VLLFLQSVARTQPSDVRAFMGRISELGAYDAQDRRQNAFVHQTYLHQVVCQHILQRTDVQAELRSLDLAGYALREEMVQRNERQPNGWSVTNLWTWLRVFHRRTAYPLPPKSGDLASDAFIGKLVGVADASKLLAWCKARKDALSVAVLAVQESAEALGESGALPGAGASDCLRALFSKAGESISPVLQEALSVELQGDDAAVRSRRGVRALHVWPLCSTALSTLLTRVQAEEEALGAEAAEEIIAEEVCEGVESTAADVDLQREQDRGLPNDGSVAAEPDWDCLPELARAPVASQAGGKDDATTLQEKHDLQHAHTFVFAGVPVPVRFPLLFCCGCGVSGLKLGTC
jgi:hypothetical protein